jgi:hypothetical protein
MTQTASKLDLAFSALLRRDADPGAWTSSCCPIRAVSSALGDR